MQFDLIILGAGPAGAAAAVTAAQAGLQVALVDKSAFPRDKLCGGGVSGRAAGFLRQIFALDPKERPGLFLTSRRVRLADRGRELALYEDAPPIHMTMRRDFDTALVEHAVAAGVTLFAPVRVVRIDPAAPALELADGRRLDAALLIGADGANSATARALYGRPFDPKRIGFALEVELPPGAGDGDRVEIDLAAASWGYGWVFPKLGSVTVGVGGVQARNPDMRAHLQRYMRESASLAAPAPDPTQAKVKGAFLPFGAYRKVPGRGAVLLAGDAAGLVDPMTGEGIAWALESGRLAGAACAAAIVAKRPQDALGSYRHALRHVHGEMRAARRIRALVYARPLARLFNTALRRHPALGESYLRLFAGERDYADIGPRRMARLLWMMARAGVRGRQRP
jgi:menaquinone-9 beta-reductase